MTHYENAPITEALIDIQFKGPETTPGSDAGRLSDSILASVHDDGFSYNSVPPLRSYIVDVFFERGREILPVPFDLDEE